MIKISRKKSNFKLKFKSNEKKLKILVIITFLSISCFLIYYFYYIFKTDVVFSHFFYIPIILTCSWWKKKGLVVPIFLAGLLLFLPFSFELNLYIIQNSLRSLMLIIVGIVVDVLSEHISKSKQVENQLTELNKFKSELLKRTSHELKTPLISIKSFTDLLLDVYIEKFDSKTFMILNNISKGCIKLEELVNKLLKSSLLKSDQVKLNFTKKNLSLLILTKIRNQSISLEIDKDLIIFFEKEMIHDVISNLLINAIKYTPPRGRIKIQSKIADNFFIISIKDNGLGLTEEEKKKIFKQFGKIERNSQGSDFGFESSGLGLYFSKKIVELHGGKIWVESEGRNKGCKFFFSLPIIIEEKLLF